MSSAGTASRLIGGIAASSSLGIRRTCLRADITRDASTPRKTRDYEVGDEAEDGCGRERSKNPNGDAL